MSMPVLRNQISIYNYPEHLNPFYQDDNHKRLRFWKIKRDRVKATTSNGCSTSTNSKSPSSSNLRRSGSNFSLSSIKEWLPLKSFTMRKKSSSLGINKTSESPPPLRHSDMTAGTVYIEDPTKYTTYNPHFRRSTGAAGGSNDVHINYRSSLQNMNQYNSFLPARTSRFRQTIQNGSITPSMRMRYGSENTMQAGISMSSINTNPFDDDYDEQSIVSASTSTTHISRTKKKKRQAPLPPQVSQKPQKNEVVNTTTSGKVKSEINDCESIQAEGISRLTKDFQNFVMETTEKEEHHHLDDEKLTKLRIDEDSSPPQPARVVELREATPDSIPLPVMEKFEVLRIEEDQTSKENVISHEKNANTKNLENIQNCNMELKNTDDTKISEVARESQTKPQEVDLKISEPIVENETSDADEMTLSVTNNVKETEPAESEANEIYEEKIINKIAVERSTTKPEPTEEKFDELKTFPNNQEHSIISTSSSITTTTLLANDSEPEVVYRSVQLRNDNSESNIGNMERVKVSSFIVDGPKHAYQDRATFLETFSPSPRPREVTPIPRTRTERDPTPPVPPVRRRSVKDIIESINRNQQLLKISNPSDDPRTKFMNSERSFSLQLDPQRFQEISSSERKVELLLDDLRNYRKSSK